jgi:hypothetical protein
MDAGGGERQVLRAHQSAADRMRALARPALALNVVKRRMCLTVSKATPYHAGMLGLRRKPADDPDALVERWKKAWIAGANAQWSTTSAVNPYPADPSRAAWQAGRDWAAQNPDRRKRTHLRLAHPLRRATDARRRIVRAVEIGAIGFGLLALWRLGWRVRRESRDRSDSKP